MIASDKLMHFGVCAGIALAVSAIGWAAGFGWPSLYAGAVASLAAGFGKEYGDKANPDNKWDWQDVMADALGAAAGLFIGALLLFLTR